ncbi:hypothetical protein [Cellulomonas hominis]
MVVMLIMGVVVAATVTLTIGFERTNAQNMARQDQIDTARTVVERMSKTLRTAVKPSQLTTSCGGTACEVDAFFTAKDYTVQFYANFDNPGNSTGPKKVSYVVATTGPDAGVLIERVQVPDSNVPTLAGYVYCDPEAGGATAECRARLTTRRLAEGVVTTSGTPLLRYYNSAGLRLTPGASGLSAEDLEKVLSIELVVKVRSTEITKPEPTTYIQRITLPNSQAVIRSGEDTP